MADNITITIAGGGTRVMRTTEGGGSIHVPHQIIDSGSITANIGTTGGIASETTLASVLNDTGRIPTSPASEHTTAASPHAVRLTDGSAFYNGATETTLAAVDTKLGNRLPAALGTGGGVKVDIVSGAGAGGEGALLDGVSSAIKATVLDYVNSNPLAVRLTDTGGDYVAAGAGTQYTEDAAAAADPVGGVTMLVRADAPGAVTTADGDNVAARGTNKGEQYVKHLDAIQIAAGSAAVGTVGVTSVPADPFGANADAASATGSISAKLRFIAATGIPITGTVTVGSHAVTNAGTFAVQVTGSTPGTGAANLGKAEDAAHTSGDVGVMNLAVRRDANTSLVDTDGDYAPLQVDAGGSLKVAIISGAGAGGGASIVDDAAFTVGSTSLTPVGGTYRSVRDLVDDNDAGAFAMTQRRALLAAIETPAGDSAMDDTNDAVRVNVVAGGAGGGAVTNVGTFAVQESGAALTSLQLIDDVVAAEDTVSADADKGVRILAVRKATPANTSGTDGDYEFLQVSGGRLWASAVIDTALPAGSNVIGALTANQSVNVAQINGVAATMGNGAAGTGVQRVTLASDSTGNIATIGTSVTPGTGAANLGKAEDAAHTSGDVGVLNLAVRRDADTTLVDATGDYAPLQVNAAGSLKVAVTSGGTAGTQYQVDAVAGATDTGTLLLAVRDDALATLTPADGDYTQLRVDSVGALQVTQAALTPTVDIVGLGDGTSTATIRNLAANDALNVAIVDGSGGHITSFGGGTQYTEDAAAAGDPVGTALIMVRKDTLAALTSADGDNVAARGTDKGELYVKHVDAVAVTNSDLTTIAADTSMTDGTQQTKITDGTTVATVRNLAANDALNVAIVDGSGAHLTSFGGGTQYADGATQATPTGTVALWLDTANVLRAPSAAKPLPVNVVAGGAGDGAILDGVSSAIKATVLDYTNSNPIAVRLTDTSGDYVGAGAGTQYTEDAAAAADPIGTALIMVRADSPAAVTSTDGDNIAARATNKGELYVKHIDTIPVTQSGTWNIGTVTTLPALVAGTANIGDVDVLTVPADPFGVNADAASATGSISAKLRFIAATGIPITGTVTVGAHAVTNAGTFAVQDSQKVADNAAFVDGTTPVQPAGFIYDEVAGTALTENDIGAARMDVKRAGVWVLEDATTRGQRAVVSAGGALKVDSTLAAADNTVGRVKITDGTTMATVRDLAAGDALNVAIVDGSGAHITSFGGGVQYTEADTDASITGTAVMWEDTADTLRAVSAAKPLPVNIVAGSSAGAQYTEDVASAGAESLTLAGAVRQDTPASSTSTDGDYTYLKTDANSKLWVHDAGIDTLVADTSMTDGTQKTQSIGSVAHDAAGTGVAPVLVGGYASAAAPTSVSADGDAVNAWFLRNGAQAVVLTAAGTLIGTSANPIRTDPVGSTTQPVSVSTASGNGGASDNPLYTRPYLSTAGGYTVVRDIDLDEATPAFIKASAGQVFGWFIANTHATAFRYVKLYNKASAPVLASDTPLLTLAIPPMGGSNVFYAHGIPFGTGIGWAATTGPGDTDAGAPGTNEVVAQLFYA